MDSENRAKTFYFISDLHFGGDGQLQMCDYTDEIIGFLQTLEGEDEQTELIINGDAFGFWELTTVKGVTQLDEIVKYHQKIFEQFRRTGEKIRITLMVGNHDYDLACYPEFADKLAVFNIALDTSISVIRNVGGRQIHIEHGQQVDDMNASPDYGNPFAQPIGYYITEKAVAGASRYSVFGTTAWLKDIRSVDVRQLPDWLISNYFYHEMSPFIRWLLVPFLVLLTITIVALAAELLKYIGVFDVNYLLNNPLMRNLGIFGNILRIIIIVSMIFWFFILTVSVPLLFVIRDVRKTLQRMQILPESDDTTIYAPNDGYLEHARRIFEQNPNVAVYIFGHTHDALLVEENGRAIINTGTWLKILKRIPASFGYLPAVYYPTFRLNYFKIYAENEKIAVEYVGVPKKPARELNFLQRLSILGKSPEPGKYIAPKTLL